MGILVVSYLKSNLQLLLKHKVHSQNQQYKRYQVIHSESFGFEYHKRKNSKNNKRNYFLNDFELD